MTWKLVQVNYYDIKFKWNPTQEKSGECIKYLFFKTKVRNSSFRYSITLPQYEEVENRNFAIILVLNWNNKHSREFWGEGAKLILS